MKLKISQNWSENTKRFALALSIILLAALISFFSLIFNYPGTKRTFVFEASDSDKLMLENRFLKDKSIECYVSELLLGPISEHCKSVFLRGTKLISCYKRDSVLYVNLSNDLVKTADTHIDFSRQIELFKKNVLLNFSSVKTINLFIDGNIPFENNKTIGENL